LPLKRKKECIIYLTMYHGPTQIQIENTITLRETLILSKLDKMNSPQTEEFCQPQQLIIRNSLLQQKLISPKELEKIIEGLIITTVIYMIKLEK